jgi:hypothetical protein
MPSSSAIASFFFGAARSRAGSGSALVATGGGANDGDAGARCPDPAESKGVLGAFWRESSPAPRPLTTLGLLADFAAG